MRMHRGSSKGSGADPPEPEHLPLSASSDIVVEVEVARARRSEVFHRSVRPGTLVRDLVRSLGEAPEGSAVLLDGRSIPLDTRLDAPVRLVLVPTFSGG